MSDVEINYKGDSLATLDNSGTKTLLTSGKYCEDDIEIVYTKPEGGGSSGSMADPIRFFDYDGTLVASYLSVPDALPSVPTHDKLTNGTWNYTLAQITTQFNAMGTCDVGANYDTVSGATEIDIELQECRLHPYLSLAVNGTVEIDWGDNSTSTSTGTSLTSRKTDIHHEYAAAGNYTIKITKTSGTGYSLYCTTIYSLLNNNNSAGNANRVYSNCVQAVRVGEDCTIGGSAFYGCYSLTSVTIPSSATSIGGSGFYNCYALTFIAIPNGVINIYANIFNNCYSLILVSIPSTVTSIGASAFYNCNSLTSISIPSSVTSISSSVFNYCNALISVSIPSSVTFINGSMFNSCYSLASVFIPSDITSIGVGAFSYCYSLASFTMPNNITSIGNGAFNYCHSLTSLIIPSGVTNIGSQAFNGCYGIAEYHFEPTTPPTLANINAFTNIQSDCKIYVPVESLEAYQTAENWSTYASYMVGE